MKKIVSIFVLALMFAGVVSAQQRLPLKVYVEDFPQPFPANAKVQMEAKINQMLTANGLGSTDMYSDFWITVIANPVDKMVVSGAPAQIMQSLEFTFYIIDANRQLIFSTYTATAKGVGQSESKSYMDAMKRVNVKAPGVVAFLDEGRKKIINYYDAEAENIFAKVRMLCNQHKYDEAFFELCGFPTECQKYTESIQVGNEIYQHYVDYNAQQYLAKARAAWAAEQNSNGAAIAGSYLSQILPEASCYSEAQVLYNEIKSKVLEDWKWEMKKYQDGVDLEKMRIQSWQAVGVAYGTHQQPTSNNIAWLR